MAVTWAISIPSGALCGFIVSRLPFPYKQFDDNPHFSNVVYGDDTQRYNEEEFTPLAMAEPTEDEKNQEKKAVGF